ncbi:hypothetical protein CC2G_010960 [Coprinopsis cinerea AmutBmut pab1-1]|nr:hypothetical protein CC2G_010960 [Coprinopsis cinerea AmutBmut pab1-1]
MVQRRRGGQERCQVLWEKTALMGLVIDGERDSDGRVDSPLSPSFILQAFSRIRLDRHWDLIPLTSTPYPARSSKDCSPFVSPSLLHLPPPPTQIRDIASDLGDPMEVSIFYAQLFEGSPRSCAARFYCL